MNGESTPVPGNPDLPPEPFRLMEEPGSWPLAEWAPAGAGFLLAVFLTALLLPSPRPYSLSRVGIWLLATRYTLPVFAASALAAWLAAVMLRSGTHRGRIETAVDVGCAATWLPALALFLRHNSHWAAVISVAMAAIGTRILLARLAAPGQNDSGRLMGPAFFTALALQAGGIGVGTYDWRAAALTLAVAVSLLTWMLTTTGIWPHRGVRPGQPVRVRIVPAFLLALTMSAGGLSPYLQPGSGSGGGSDFGTGILKALFGEGEQEGEKDQPGKTVAVKPGSGPFATPALVVGESYPGVILWPDPENYSTLVPPLPRADRMIFGPAAKALDSLSIAFYGAYLFYRGVGPPKNSFVAHGDPARLGFRSSDLRPLKMEATQNFGRLLSMDCCSRIEVAVRNEDRTPGTVGLELIVRNTSVASKPWQSLGVDLLTRKLAPPGTAAPPEEVVPFQMPAVRRIDQFDEVTVRFHLMAPRSDRSARIAIRRFTFVR